MSWLYLNVKLNAGFIIKVTNRGNGMKHLFKISFFAERDWQGV